MTFDPLDSDETKDQTPADAGVAEETSSPDVTDGVSSSDTAPEETQETAAEAIRNKFLEEYGDPTEEPEDGVTSEGDDADTKPEGERKEAPEAKDDAAEKPVDQDDETDEHHIPREEFGKLSPNVRKRIGYLNDRAKKAEKQLGDYTQQLEALKPVKEQWEGLEGFVQEHGIAPEHMAASFGMMAKFASGDYAGFLSDMEPYAKAARQAAGVDYDPKYQQQVDEGYLTEEAAREMTRSQIANQRLQAQNKQLTERQAAEGQREKQAQVVRSIVGAVDAAEKELLGSDPDYARMQQAVMRNMQLAMERGVRFETPEQAVKYFKDTYAAAKETAKAFRPKDPAPTPTRPTASTLARGQREPQSLEDAISNAAETYVPQ
ncbi:hypothetical protein [uncultured Maritimibacter sp.]|uniref:hypothetical protein n=1 Tax=uncultured Maritimibacter sp. TaxID=991866 RepID=UPI00259596B9|nr:hypothetical protein [uncultured Maritimibacter sp.]